MTSTTHAAIVAEKLWESVERVFGPPPFVAPKGSTEVTLVRVPGGWIRTWTNGQTTLTMRFFG